MSKRSVFFIVLVVCLVIGGYLFFSFRGAGTPVVPQGQVYVYRDPDYIPPALGVTTQFKIYDPNNQEQVQAVAKRYKDVYIEFQPFYEVLNQPIDKQNYAKVGSSQLGLIDNFILPPGNYYRIPQSDVQIVDAAVVQPENYGINRGLDSKGNVIYTLLPPGIHRALSDQVHFFPVGPRRYRLIAANLLNNKDIDACQSALCETTLSDVLTADPAVRVAVDLEVNFQYNFTDNPENLARLYELKDEKTIITTYISSPVRAQGRSLWGNITPAEMQTSAGWQKMIDALTKMFIGSPDHPGVFGNQPIELISVGIRGVTLPESYLKNQGQGVADEQQLQAQTRLAQLSQNATATANAFVVDQQQKETQALASQMKALKDALGSNDPIVVCGILNFFKPGSCVIPPGGVSVNVSGSNK